MSAETKSVVEAVQRSLQSRCAVDEIFCAIDGVFFAGFAERSLDESRRLAGIPANVEAVIGLRIDDAVQPELLVLQFTRDLILGDAIRFGVVDGLAAGLLHSVVDAFRLRATVKLSISDVVSETDMFAW